MEVHSTYIPGLLLIEPKMFSDERGFFLESYHARRLQQAGIVGSFVQDNHSRSLYGVLRGLHYTISRPQAQTVYVSDGTIFDVAVDLRQGSPCFGKWFGVELSGNRPRILYLPPGFAHGFCVLSKKADVHYKVTHFYEPDDEAGLRWDDPTISISWPLSQPTIKDRDQKFPLLKDVARSSLPQVAFG